MLCSLMRLDPHAEYNAATIQASFWDQLLVQFHAFMLRQYVQMRPNTSLPKHKIV